MQRINQLILIGTFLIGTFVPFCWLAFMLLHELGHIAAAVVSGGSVRQAVLYPLTFSRTDVEPNPHPLLVVWAGPIFWALLPLLIWWLFRRFQMPGDYLARFFASFCLVAAVGFVMILSGPPLSLFRFVLASPVWKLERGVLMWVSCGLILAFSLKYFWTDQADRASEEKSSVGTF